MTASTYILEKTPKIFMKNRFLQMWLWSHEISFQSLCQVSRAVKIGHTAIASRKIQPSKDLEQKLSKETHLIDEESRNSYWTT